VITAIAERKLSNPLGTKEQRLSEYVKKNQKKPEVIPEISTENGPTGEKKIVATLLNRATLRLP
jgi:phosphopantetheine adenylyltransferase